MHIVYNLWNYKQMFWKCFSNWNESLLICFSSWIRSPSQSMTTFSVSSNEREIHFAPKPNTPATHPKHIYSNFETTFFWKLIFVFSVCIYFHRRHGQRGREFNYRKHWAVSDKVCQLTHYILYLRMFDVFFLVFIRNALNIVKDDLIVKVDELTGEIEILREELNTANQARTKLRQKVSDLEDELKQNKTLAKAHGESILSTGIVVRRFMFFSSFVRSSFRSRRRRRCADGATQTFH